MADLAGVRLVCTDMDGTLLSSEGKVRDEFFSLFEALHEHDVHFVAASGRQHASICQKLESLVPHITVVAENGSLTKAQGTETASVVLSRTEVADVITLVRAMPAQCSMVLCGKDCAYVESKDEQFLSLFPEYYPSHALVSDLLQVEGDGFLKIAIHTRGSSEQDLHPHMAHLEEREANELLLKVSGQHWLDVSHRDANKGYAIAAVQQARGITATETMAFGDYNNDLEMLSDNVAYFSIAMENGHPNVHATARFRTASNDACGVEVALRELLKAKQGHAHALEPRASSSFSSTAEESK